MRKDHRRGRELSRIIRKMGLWILCVVSISVRDCVLLPHREFTLGDSASQRLILNAQKMTVSLIHFKLEKGKLLEP
jgi:hypothetical protein